MGFVLLTHEKPNQVLRLVERLNFMFDDPPIACHHDFSKCDFLTENFPENITFVKPHIKTKWGHWSLIEATIKGIELLYSGKNKPQWFTLLSGSDYPIRTAGEIIRDIKNSQFDAHIDSKKLVKSKLKDDADKAMYFRYHSVVFSFPSVVHLIQSFRIRKWITEEIRVKNPTYTRYLIPFSDEFICYVGSQWFSANQKAAESILEYHKRHSKLRNFYKKVSFADESYLHTILNNTNDLKINNRYWRYTDWSGQTAHPRTLTIKDFPKLLESDDHFARKFDADVDPDVLDRLDEVIGYRQ